MPDFGKMRFNDNLLGRLVVAKRCGNALDDDNFNKNVKTQSTITPVIKFASLHEWIATIKEDAKILENSRIERELAEETMNTNLEYHLDWLETKFKIN